MRCRAFLVFIVGWLAGCGGDGDVPNALDAGAEIGGEAEPSDRRKEGAYLAARGGQRFAGRSAFRCMPHGEEGLQISFRTGDAEMPAVAVQVERFTGDGTYQGRVFVTGRSAGGALVRSSGEIAVEVRQRELPDAASVVLLEGELRGAYRGGAGQGEVEGRFGPCSYVRRVTVAPPEVAERPSGSAPRPGSD